MSMEQSDGNCHEMSQLVVKCCKVSWRLSLIVVTFVFRSFWVFAKIFVCNLMVDDGTPDFLSLMLLRYRKRPKATTRRTVSNVGVTPSAAGLSLVAQPTGPHQLNCFSALSLSLSLSLSLLSLLSLSLSCLLSLSPSLMIAIALSLSLSLSHVCSLSLSLCLSVFLCHSVLSCA